MGNLYIGGQRNANLNRMSDAKQISVFCKRRQFRHLEPAHGSIANRPHKNEREIARRLRQAERQIS